MRGISGALLAVALLTQTAYAQTLRSMIEEFTIGDFLSDQIDAEARTIIEFAEASGKYLLDKRAWRWRSNDHESRMWRIRTAREILFKINEENAQRLRQIEQIEIESGRAPNSILPTYRGTNPYAGTPPAVRLTPPEQPQQLSSPPSYVPRSRDTPVQTAPVPTESLQELRKMYPGYGEGPANGRTSSGAGFVEGDHPGKPCDPGISRRTCRELRRPLPRSGGGDYGGGGGSPTIAR